MDPLSFGFLLMVAIGGGIIAYLADRLGRNIGKKRKSLFGLRPRHTAEVLIVGAGVCIPIITILVVMAASAEVRTWFFEGRAAIADRAKLRKDVETLTGERQRLQTDIEAGSQRLVTLNADLVKSRAAVDEYKESAEKLTKEVERRSGEVKRLDSQLRTASKAVADKTKLVADKQVEYEKLNDSFMALIEQTDEERDRNLELTQETLRLEREVAGLEATIANLGNDLAKLRTENDAASREREALDASLKRLAEEFETLKRTSEADLARNRQLLSETQEQLELKQRQLQQLIGQVDLNLQITRTRPMIFAQEEELVRLPIPPSQSLRESNALVSALIGRAAEEAVTRGSQPKEPGGMAAGFVPFQIDGRTVGIEEQGDNLVQGIATKPEELVLVATAAWNTFMGEFTPLVVRIYRNPVVFRAGEVLAEVRIEGRSSEADVLKAITEDLLMRVRAKAQEVKMVPRQGSDQPYGSIASGDIVQIVRRVTELEGQVRVQAVALVETRAADSLKIELRIR